MSTPLFKRFKRTDHIGLVCSFVPTTQAEVAVAVTGPAAGQFAGTLANQGHTPGSLVITTDSGRVITDNGDGTLGGHVDGGGANTIDYLTGAYDFTADDGVLSTTADFAYEAGPVTNMRTVEVDLTDDNGNAMDDLEAITIAGGSASYRMMLVPESEAKDTTLMAKTYAARISLYDLQHLGWAVDRPEVAVPGGRWKKLIIAARDYAQWSALEGGSDRDIILLHRSSAGAGRNINWKSRKANGDPIITPGVVSATAPAFDY